MASYIPICMGIGLSSGARYLCLMVGGGNISGKNIVPLGSDCGI